MKKPYIVAIDDDLPVLRAVERDLKAKFSTHCRVPAADSLAAIDAFNKVKLIGVGGLRGAALNLVAAPGLHSLHNKSVRLRCVNAHPAQKENST